MEFSNLYLGPFVPCVFQNIIASQTLQVESFWWTSENEDMFLQETFNFLKSLNYNYIKCDCKNILKSKVAKDFGLIYLEN